MPQPARIRQPVACLPCREKKVKCDGLRPCAYCKKHDWECIFPSRSRKRIQVTNDQDVSKRLARVEALLGTENVRSSIHPETGSAAPTNYGQGSVLSPVSDHQQTIQWAEGSSRLYGNCNRSEDQPSRLSPSSNAAPVVWKQPTEASISVDSGRIDSPSDHESGLIEQNTTHEYHGAGSMLSVFSKLGSEWVYKQTGVSEFESMARSLASQIVSWLKLTQRIPEERVAEPDRDTALELSSAYFEDNEISNGILHQPSFELRLRRFFDTPDSSSADPGWYALRNTVYAGGKRKMLKDAGTADFNDVHSGAFPYFANALAVHTEMIYYKSSMTAVQALVAMAYYAEAIGAPHLEYTLQSNAVRLAQSKALHRKVPHTLGFSQFEKQQRSLLFWSMYIQEKHIAYWSGRPSALDDDVITCPLPETIDFGNDDRTSYFNLLIRLTRILSAVLKFTSRLETQGMTQDKILRRVQHLNAQLHTWKESAPLACRPEPLRKSSLPSSVSIDLILYIRYTYYGAAIALNSCFTYPWLMERVSYKEDARFQKQIEESAALVAEMSRNTIKDTKHIDIDFTSPTWLVFYHPFVGLIHLFVHIIKCPSAPTVQYDLALLEDICGHFARLNYTTSSALYFPVIKELCRFAEHIVNVESKPPTDDSNQTMNGILHGTKPVGFGIQRNLPEGDDGVSSNEHTDFSEALNFDFLDTDLSFEVLHPTYTDDDLL